MPYQLYNSRYRVLSKLGAGAFSTVWLCADEKDQSECGPELAASKVCKSKKSVTEQAVDEIALLERLQENGSFSPHVVQMRGHFWHTGPNGRHKCMVFEVMGENLLALVKHHDYNGLPLRMVRRLARHTLLGLEYIHARGVIHTDVKLENVLVQRHDLEDLQREARRAHRAFTEQKSGVAALSKSQKKRLKKKQKNAKAKGEADSDGEGGAASCAGASADAGTEVTPKSANPLVAGAPEGAAKANVGATGGEMSDTDRAAAEACGRPVPPVRQRDRFNTLEPDMVFAKLADFGNGCRSNRKVTDDIQTRQYRSPEVIIGAEWDETADLWSAACMFFELITGDFLFDPRTGEDWTRDEDHLALMIELLGDHPDKEWALSGRYSREFFNNSGRLKHIKNLKYWSLHDVMTQKYSVDEDEVEEVCEMLLTMLRWEPCKRATATEALKHRWTRLREGESDEVQPQISRQQQVAATPETVEGHIAAEDPPVLGTVRTANGLEAAEPGEAAVVTEGPAAAKVALATEVNVAIETVVVAGCSELVKAPLDVAADSTETETPCAGATDAEYSNTSSEDAGQGNADNMPLQVSDIPPDENCTEDTALIAQTDTVDNVCECCLVAADASPTSVVHAVVTASGPCDVDLPVEAGSQVVVGVEDADAASSFQEEGPSTANAGNNVASQGEGTDDTQVHRVRVESAQQQQPMSIAAADVAKATCMASADAGGVSQMAADGGSEDVAATDLSAPEPSDAAGDNEPLEPNEKAPVANVDGLVSGGKKKKNKKKGKR